jgi:glucokinase
MEIMMSAYGAEAGNLGLTLIPLGGIYIAGGIAPNNSQYLKDANSPFITAFRDKGRLSNLLDKASALF